MRPSTGEGERLDLDTLRERGERLGHRVWALPNPPPNPSSRDSSSTGASGSLQRATLRSAAEAFDPAALYGPRDGEAVGGDVESEIQAARATGRPLDASTRAPMERAFGRDFASVRTHRDERAAGLADRLNARAFTTGGDIFWGRDAPSPESASGQELLAHELTHVVQQGASSSLEVGSSGGVEAGESVQRSVDGSVEERLQRADLVSPANNQQLLQQALAAWNIPFGDFEAEDLVFWDRGQAWQGTWLAIIAETGGRTYFQEVAPGAGQGDLYVLEGQYGGTGNYDIEPLEGGVPIDDEEGLEDLDGDDIELVPVGMDEDDETYQVEVEDEEDSESVPIEIMVIEKSGTKMDVEESKPLVRTPISEDVIMGGMEVSAFRSLPGVVGQRSVGGDFISRVEARRSSGEPLATDLQRQIGDRLGEDLSSVRVHADGVASSLAREAGARAFATGDDIFFGADEYRPTTRSGRELVAHEATHVAQARRGAPFFGSRAASRIGSSPFGRSSLQRHPGYVGHGGGGPGGHAITPLAGQGYLGTLGAAAGTQHQAVVGGAVNQANDTLNWTAAPAGALGGGVAHYKGQVKPGAGTVTHRANSRAIRNPAVTRGFANSAPVKAWIAAYIVKTGYVGKWNMHHWWPLAWDGDDVATNLTPLPTALGGVAHQTHGQWHQTLRTGGGKMWPRTVSQHYKNV